jgi:hypothetical protein
VKQWRVLLFAAPLLVGARGSDEQAVQDVLRKISAGESLPQEILDRQEGLPDLDEAIAKAKGCHPDANRALLDPDIFAVSWKCKGRDKGDKPVPMLVYVKNGTVNRIVTAIMRTEVRRHVPIS